MVFGIPQRLSDAPRRVVATQYSTTLQLHTSKLSGLCAATVSILSSWQDRNSRLTAKQKRFL